MTGKDRRHASLMPFALLCCVGSAGAAAATDMAISAGLGHSDNIARSDLNKIDETIADVGVQLVVDQKSNRLDANILGDVSYNKYLDNTYDNEVIGSVNGVALLRVVPDRLNWIVQDNFGQSRRDPFAAVTPANRENTNNFTTGPDLLLRVGSANELRLGGRYSRVDYEKSLLDSQRYSGEFSLAHDLSSASTVAAHARTESIRYADDTGQPDYDRQGAFLRYALRSGRTQGSLDAGVNRIDRLGNTSDGALLKLNLSRTLGRFSVLTLGLGREFTDGGSALASQGGSPGALGGASSISQSGEPYNNDYVNLAWDATGRRTQLGASVAYTDESYQQTAALDRKHLQASAYVGRNFGADWSARLTGRLEKFEYRLIGTDYRETSLIALLSRRLGRDLHIDLSAERNDRSSDLVLTEYGENRVTLRIRYGEVSTGVVSALGQDSGRTR